MQLHSLKKRVFHHNPFTLSAPPFPLLLLPFRLPPAARAPLAMLLLLFRLFQYGRTPLHWAAIHGDKLNAKRLLSNGADPTTRETRVSPPPARPPSPLGNDARSFVGGWRALALDDFNPALFCLSQNGRTEASAFKLAEKYGHREVVAIFNEFASVRAFPCCPPPFCRVRRQPHQLHLGPARVPLFRTTCLFTCLTCLFTCRTPRRPR